MAITNRTRTYVATYYITPCTHIRLTRLCSNIIVTFLLINRTYKHYKVFEYNYVLHNIMSSMGGQKKKALLVACGPRAVGLITPI